MERGLTLDQLAERARVSRSTLAKIEGGATPDPGFTVVAALLGALEADDEVVLHLYRVAAATRAPGAFGIGYEGRDLPDLLEELKRRRVEVVADVRLNPISRKPGLSKTALKTALSCAQIEYQHFPLLGNPKQNRAGYADPNDAAPREAFRALLTDTEAALELDRLRLLAAQRVVAVLCFEEDQALCHRQQVLDAVLA